MHSHGSLWDSMVARHLFEPSSVPVPAGTVPWQRRSPFSIEFECIGDESGGRVGFYMRLFKQQLAAAYKLPTPPTTGANGGNDATSMRR